MSEDSVIIGQGNDEISCSAMWCIIVLDYEVYIATCLTSRENHVWHLSRNGTLALSDSPERCLGWNERYKLTIIDFR